MASIKVRFRPSAVVGQLGNIHYSVIHEKQTRHIISDHSVFPSEWDTRSSMVKIPWNADRQAEVTAIRQRIRQDLERLAKIVSKLDNGPTPYTADDVTEEYRRFKEEYSLVNFTQSLIRKFRENGKQRTSETYCAALKSFRRFLISLPRKEENYKKGDIMLDCLTSELTEGYEAWLRGRGVAPNTVSFYMRILRAVYNRALESEIMTDHRPFRHVYTGIENTKKRSLPLGIIKKMRGLDLSLAPHLEYARDLFLLSFMLRGMSFVDMAFLRKTDLSNGYVTYRRHKTGQLLSIKWTREMQRILDKYGKNESDYLLPIIRNTSCNDRKAYRNASYRVNYGLKRIAKMIGARLPLTLYVARHSWASAARAKGVRIAVISEGLGHNSENTTQIYLASLDSSLVDKANSLILSSI